MKTRTHFAHRIDMLDADGEIQALRPMLCSRLTTAITRRCERKQRSLAWRC
jgi:hypothetical protein